MSELCVGDVIGPGSGVIPTEDLKVCFDFLVHPFGFPVRFGVVGGGKGKVIFQEFSQFSGKGGCELGSTVRDDFVVKAEAKVYFVEKECGDAFGGDVFLCGTENHPLSKPVVDHDQKGIEAGGDREVSDKVTGDLLEGAGCGGADGGEQQDGRMGVGFVLLAGCTTLNVFSDIRGEAGPPEFSCNELSGFEIARVTGTVVVVAAFENSVPQGVVTWDIDAALIGQDACFDLPVGEAGTEGEREVVVHGLKGLEDEGVTRGCRLDTVREGNINNVDEERWGKESDSIIVVVRVGKEVGTTRQGVRTGKEFSWDVDHF